MFCCTQTVGRGLDGANQALIFLGLPLKSFVLQRAASAVHSASTAAHPQPVLQAAVRPSLPPARSQSAPAGEQDERYQSRHDVQVGSQPATDDILQ